MGKFIIDRDTKSLEYSKWRFLIEARRFDNLEEFESRIDFLDFSHFLYRTSDKPRFLLFSICSKYSSKLGRRKSHDKVSSRLPLTTIEAHIQRSVEPQRKSTISLIEMYATYSEIVEYEVCFAISDGYESIFESRETLWYIVLLDIRCKRREMGFCSTEILTISIKSYELPFSHLRHESASMSPKSECRIDDGLWVRI